MLDKKTAANQQPYLFVLLSFVPIVLIILGLSYGFILTKFLPLLVIGLCYFGLLYFLSRKFSLAIAVYTLSGVGMVLITPIALLLAGFTYALLVVLGYLLLLYVVSRSYSFHTSNEFKLLITYALMGAIMLTIMVFQGFMHFFDRGGHPLYLPTDIIIVDLVYLAFFYLTSKQLAVKWPVAKGVRNLAYIIGLLPFIWPLLAILF